MKYLYICALVCGAFIFASAQSSSNTSPTSFIDNIQNEFQNIINSVENAVGDFEQTMQNGTSALSGKKGMFNSGIIDTIIKTITNAGNQVANVFVAPMTKGLNAVADGVVKSVKTSMSSLEKLQTCASNEQKNIDISAPIQAVETCAMNAVHQIAAVIDQGIDNMEKIASDFGGSFNDAMKCVGSVNIFKCIGSVTNGVLRGVQDISSTATKGVSMGTDIATIAPVAVGCMAGTVNGIIQNITNLGINVNDCIL